MFTINTLIIRHYELCQLESHTIQLTYSLSTAEAAVAAGGWMPVGLLWYTHCLLVAGVLSPDADI